MTTRASIDQIKQREGAKRLKIRKLTSKMRQDHSDDLSVDAEAYRYRTFMARLNEIEEGEG